jgi:hypothetical protein
MEEIMVELVGMSLAVMLTYIPVIHHSIHQPHHEHIYQDGFKMSIYQGCTRASNICYINLKNLSNQPATSYKQLKEASYRCISQSWISVFISSSSSFLVFIMLPVSLLDSRWIA